MDPDFLPSIPRIEPAERERTDLTGKGVNAK